MTQETSERVVEKSVTVVRPGRARVRGLHGRDRDVVAAAHARGRHRAVGNRGHGGTGRRKALRAHAVRRGARLGHARRLGAAHRVVYSWHPGRGEETAQEVEITFGPEGEGTRVDIRHYGWERLGDRLEETIASYNEGWDKVIAVYARAAERS